MVMAPDTGIEAASGISILALIDRIRYDCLMPYRMKYDQALAAKRHYDRNKAKIKKRAYAYKAKKRGINKALIRKWLMDHSCVDCGNTNPIVLDFDHVRGTKVDAICTMVRNALSIKKIMAEVAKCDVRCSNCHRIVTFERRVAASETEKKDRRKDTNKRSLWEQLEF